jgi:polyisoprenoid-binding protein YceI
MTRFLLAAALALAATGSAAAATYKIDPRHTQVFFTYGHNAIFQPQRTPQRSQRHARVRPGQARRVLDQPGTAAVQPEHRRAGPGRAHAQRRFLRRGEIPHGQLQEHKVTCATPPTFDLAGDLTIKGVTSAAVFAVTVNHIGENARRKTPMAGFDAVATIKRSEFGVDNMLARDRRRDHAAREHGGCVPKDEPAEARRGAGRQA